LERRLTIALSNLIVDDWRLLTIWAKKAGPAGERAVAAGLGWHIKALMERSWDVDCEYNRDGMADEVAPKRQSDAGATDGKLVTPDLVVHRRGSSGRANNLLVLELKKNDDGNGSSANRISRGGSLESILGIQKKFGYQHAVLLNLRLTKHGPTPQWTWVEFADRKNKAAREPDEVYEASSLRILCQRGRAEETRRYGS
jgi:hypothetical protein